VLSCNYWYCVCLRHFLRVCLRCCAGRIVFILSSAER
jgi:hypothetical protein